MQDISEYLSKEVGICVSKEIVVHLLWADDLILFSDSAEGLQKQLDGLYKYCAKNHMIVNETKNKVMCFGKNTEIQVKYNGFSCIRLHIAIQLGQWPLLLRKLTGD